MKKKREKLKKTNMGKIHKDEKNESIFPTCKDISNIFFYFLICLSFFKLLDLSFMSQSCASKFEKGIIKIRSEMNDLKNTYNTKLEKMKNENFKFESEEFLILKSFSITMIHFLMEFNKNNSNLENSIVKEKQNEQKDLDIEYYEDLECNEAFLGPICPELGHPIKNKKSQNDIINSILKLSVVTGVVPSRYSYYIPDCGEDEILYQCNDPILNKRYKQKHCENYPFIKKIAICIKKYNKSNICNGIPHFATDVCSNYGECIGKDHCICDRGYFGMNCQNKL